MQTLNPMDTWKFPAPSYVTGFHAPMSAYMSTRHVKPPPPLFFFPFFLPRLSLVRPRRRLSLAPTAGCWRRRAQGVSRLAAFQRPPSGSAFTRPSTTAGLMGSVDYYSCPVTYPSSQRALFRSRLEWATSEAHSEETQKTSRCAGLDRGSGMRWHRRRMTSARSGWLCAKQLATTSRCIDPDWGGRRPRGWLHARSEGF